MGKKKNPAGDVIKDMETMLENDMVPKKPSRSKSRKEEKDVPREEPVVAMAADDSQKKGKKKKSDVSPLGTTGEGYNTQISFEDKDTKSSVRKKPLAGSGFLNEFTDAGAPQSEADRVTEAAMKADEFLNQKSQKNMEIETKPKPQVRYSDEDLDMFRERINDVRKEAIEELTMLKERLEDLTNYDFAEESMIYSMHMAEQGSEAMEKEKTYAQIQRINEYIKKLDEALQRIAEKTYGICRVCGILIAKERLLAVPITTLSASYKIHKRCPEDGIDLIEPVRE